MLAIPGARGRARYNFRVRGLAVACDRRCRRLSDQPLAAQRGKGHAVVHQHPRSLTVAVLEQRLQAPQRALRLALGHAADEHTKAAAPRKPPGALNSFS